MYQTCVNRARLVSDAELSNPEFIRRVRAFAASLNIGASALLDHLLNEFSRSECVIVDARGQPAELHMDVFEPSDADIDAGREPRVRARIIEWFAAFIGPCPDSVRPRIRCEARERFRVVASLLRALHPSEALTWSAANDNFALVPESHEEAGA